MTVLKLILNELSVFPCAPDRVTARHNMKILDDTLRAARARGAAPSLHTHVEFSTIELAPGYTLAQWASDPAVDRDMVRSIHRMASKGPFLDDLHCAAEAELGELAECMLDGRPALGFGVAAMQDQVAVSLSTVPWKRDHVQVEVHYVGSQDTRQTQISVINAHEPQSIERHLSWIEGRLSAELQNGVLLVARTASIFDRLDFTSGAREQLRALTGNERPFPHVLRHLFALNARARTWTSGSFEDQYPFPCSQESNATLARFKHERRFVCPDGTCRMFSYHTKINVEKWRIHFIPTDQTRRVLVGYVGTHLPTVNDPT
jgi:hypothetical protein